MNNIAKTKQLLESSIQYKSVKLIKGYHLTAVEKKQLVQSVNRRDEFTNDKGEIRTGTKHKQYVILPTDEVDVFTATISEKRKDDYGRVQNDEQKVTIKFK